MRPPNSLLVIGTDTDVGKTVVTAMLIEAYKGLNLNPAPFKPIVAGSTTNDKGPFWADISFLSKASGVPEDDIKQFCFDKPLSPHTAAESVSEKISQSAIIDKFKYLRSRYDGVVVEGTGGLMTPITPTDTWLDLAQKLDLPVLIVTRPSLGTLNHTLLTVYACRDRGLNVVGLIVDNYPADPNEAERTNPEELRKLTSLPLIGVIPKLDINVSNLRVNGLAEGVRHLKLDKLKTARPDFSNAIEADKEHVWHPFSQMTEYLSEKPHPTMIVKAAGCRLEDSDGRRYIDGISSLWVNVHGHRQPALDAAVKDQLSKVAHTTLLGLSNEPSALLAEELTDIAPEGLNKVFYSDDGSTAVEAALKVAFQYWRQSGRPEKTEFVSFINAYHGDTIGSVSVGGYATFHSIFKPLLFPANLSSSAYCYRCPVELTYPSCRLACLNQLETLLAEKNERIAAVVFEPKVQGAAGILVQPPGYLKKVADLCRRYNVLLIADEVAVGFGRTGKLFACEHENATPDIMCLAKGITGGYLPLAATLFRQNIYDAFLGRYEELKTFFHGHSYTGNPLAASAARANLKLVTDPGFMTNVRKKAAAAATLLKPLAELEHVGDIRQCGLMVGIELVADKETKEPFPPARRVGRQAILKARERNVIIRPLGDVIVLMPPAIIDNDDLKTLIDVTAWAIENVT